MCYSINLGGKSMREMSLLLMFLIIIIEQLKHLISKEEMTFCIKNSIYD